MGPGSAGDPSLDLDSSFKSEDGTPSTAHATAIFGGMTAR